MATRNDDPTSGGAAKANETTSSTEKASPSSAVHETVVSETGTKKKKRRYGRGMRGIQGLERGVTESLETVSEGVARMLRTYNKQREKSSRKKRDGALRDGMKNWAKAMGKGLRTAANAPYDFVRAANKGGGSKQVRKTVRLLIPPPLR